MPSQTLLSARVFPTVSEVLYRLRLPFPYHWRWLADRIGDRYLDRKFGIASFPRRSLAEFGLDCPDCTDYQPVSYPDFRKLLDAVDVGSSDVFLDFGSGMGRALCLAAQYPFRSVIGVEMSSQLCGIAIQNIEQVKLKLLCKDVQVVNTNATNYEIPQHVSVVYFFNPFGGSVLSKVLDNVRSSLCAAPRRLIILFYGTASSAAFRLEASTRDWLALQSELMLPTGTIGLVYTNTRWTI